MSDPTPAARDIPPSVDDALDTRAYAAMPGAGGLDMSPMAGAFDTVAATETDDSDATLAGGAASPQGNHRSVGSDDSGARETGDDSQDQHAPAGGGSRRWRVPAMVAGGLTIGVLVSGGVAWSVVSARNAEVSSKAEQVEAQSRKLAEQATMIEVLNRAISERPVPSVSPTGPSAAQAQSAAETTLAIPGHAASPTMGTAAPRADVAPVVVPAVAGLPAVARAPIVQSPVVVANPGTTKPAASAPPAFRNSEPQPARSSESSGTPPSQAGSGICDIPAGADGHKAMRKCIEWFSGKAPASTPR